MAAEPSATATRSDRRKARTRLALLEAAQRFLSEGRSAVSIQEITEAADVGFGSFYNHFSSKEELFDAAVDATLQAYAAFRDEAVAGLADPAEVFAVSFRMTGRLQRQVPEMVRVILNHGMAILSRDEGLAPRARNDIAAAQEAGRFEPMDLDLAVMAAGGALLGLLQMLESSPDADADALSDQMTYQVLRMFGMPKRAAEKLCGTPLPAQPEL